MRRKWHIISFFSLFFVGYNTHAFDISPDKAVQMALDYNLNLKKTSIDLDTSGYSIKNLWSELFPAINATTSATYANPLFSGDGFTFSKDDFRYGIGLGVVLDLNSGIPSSLNSVKLAHRINVLKYEDAKKQLSVQVIKKYFMLLAEKNNLEYLGEIRSLAQKQYERNLISFKNGLLKELELMQSSLALENANYALSATEVSYTNNLGDFLSMMGIQPDAEVSLSGNIDIVKINADAEILIKTYLDKRPDIIWSKSEIERLENEKNKTLTAGRAPSLRLSVDWNSSNFDPFTDSLSGTARVTIPIDPWIGGTAKNQSFKKADDAISKSKLDLQITEEAAKNQIRSLTLLLRNSWNSIEIARLGQELARHSYELTEQGFRNGIIESLAVEDARNNMANATVRLLQSELSYFNMILDLSAALNIDWKILISNYGESSESK
jgi:outer membrane protein TolC